MSDHGAIAEVHQYVHLGYTLTDTPRRGCP